MPRMRNRSPTPVRFGVTFTKWGTPATEIDYKVYTIRPRSINNPELGRKQTGTAGDREECGDRLMRDLQRRNHGRGADGRECGCR